MKKLITTLEFLVISGSLFFLCIFADCSNNDEEPNEEINIMGLWTVSEVEISEASIGGQSIVDFFINIGGMSQEDATLAYSFLEASIIASMTGTIDIRDDYTYTSVFGNETVDGTWSESAGGKTFSIDDDTDDVFVATVITLTDNMANLSFDLDTYQDIDLNPLTPDVLLTLKGTMILTR
jgi:hypothetical protein